MDNKKERLFFPEDIFDIFSEIQKKYKLEETSDGISEKLKNGLPFYGESIMGVVKDFIFGKIQ